MAIKTAYPNKNAPDFSNVFNWGLKITNFTELFIVTGHGAVGADFQVRHPGDAIGQTRDVLEQMDGLLTGAGYNKNDIIKLEVTVTKDVNPDDFEGMVGAMSEYFADIDVKPAAGTYRVVDDLAVPGMLVEYEFLLAR